MLMTAHPQQGERHCEHCGCVMAADDTQPVCSPCRRGWIDRQSDGYRAQHDAELRRRVLEALQAHRGERVNIYRVMGMWPCGMTEWRTVKNIVKYLRRHGHTIYGFSQSGEYEYVDGARIES